MKEKIIDIIAQNRPDIEISDSTRFIEDGIFDSFDIVTLVSELDKAFGISIDGEKIRPEYFNTLSDIERLVRSSQ